MLGKLTSHIHVRLIKMYHMAGHTVLLQHNPLSDLQLDQTSSRHVSEHNQKHIRNPIISMVCENMGGPCGSTSTSVYPGTIEKSTRVLACEL